MAKNIIADRKDSDNEQIRTLRDCYYCLTTFLHVYLLYFEIFSKL